MAFKSTFKLNSDSKEFDVLDCKVAFKRDVDAKGRPASDIYGGRIMVVVESTPDTIILEHMFNQFKPCAGNIVFKKADEEAKMKELVFENAYIIDYEEGVNVSGESPMAIRFVISAQVIKMGGAQFEQNWPEAN